MEDAVSDAIFNDPRLARVYDPLDPDRSDLDAYLGIVDEFGARRVLDIGCGTGTFACMLSTRAIDVIGLEPAGASLDVARSKPGADGVRWIDGDISALPPVQVDMVTMTANVAQVFLTDAAWSDVLRGAHESLRPGGNLVFETRDPARKAWLAWNKQDSYVRVNIPEVGLVQSWEELVEVRNGLVSFRSVTNFERSSEQIVSTSTIRFRGLDELRASLRAAGFLVDDIRDAPDRPGKEFVFVARKAARSKYTQES